ncbi:MAG: hypothetical protein ACLS69_00620 [Butyricicoccus sp.]
MSLRRAWDYMNKNDIQTLAVVDGPPSEWTADAERHRALTWRIRTRTRWPRQRPATNLVDVLDGTLRQRRARAAVEQGRVVVAAANPDVLEDYIAPNDMVILGNRYEPAVRH